MKTIERYRGHEIVEHGRIHKTYTIGSKSKVFSASLDEVHESIDRYYRCIDAILADEETYTTCLPIPEIAWHKADMAKRGWFCEREEAVEDCHSHRYLHYRKNSHSVSPAESTSEAG